MIGGGDANPKEEGYMPRSIRYLLTGLSSIVEHVQLVPYTFDQVGNLQLDADSIEADFRHAVEQVGGYEWIVYWNNPH